MELLGGKEELKGEVYLKQWFLNLKKYKHPTIRNTFYITHMYKTETKIS